MYERNIIMKENERLLILKDRLAKLSNTPKNIKCPGVVRKLRRQVRNSEAKLS